MISAPEDDPRVIVRPFRPNGFHPLLDDVGGDPAPILPCIVASSFANKPRPERSWLVRDLIPDRTVTMLAGDGGVGKSLLAKQLGVAVATATDWIGTLPDSGAVLYLSAEDDADEVHRRLVDITAATGMQLAELDAFHLIPLAGRDAVIAAPERRSELIVATPLWHLIVAKVDELRPRLVIIDNLADAFAGNENSRPQARQFVGLLRGLAIAHGLAVVLIAHPSLTGLSTGSGTSGTTAWSNSVRSRLYLDRAKAEDGVEPDPDLRVLRTMKANYAATGAEITIRWEQGRFRTDGFGAGTFDRLVADQRAERVFLDLVSLFETEGRDVSPNPGPNYAPVIFAAHAKSEGLKKKALKEAMDRLFTAAKIRTEGSGPPSRRRTRLVIERSEEG